MTKPVLHDWVVGEKITAALLDDLAAAIAFVLDDQPRVAIYDDSGVSCTDGAFTRIPMTNEITGSDNDNMWSSSYPSRVWLRTAGWYHFECAIAFSSSYTYTELNINARLNSGGSSTGGTSIRNMPFGAGRSAARLTFDRTFNADDYVEMFVSQTSGAARTTLTGNNVTGITCHRFGG